MMTIYASRNRGILPQTPPGDDISWTSFLVSDKLWGAGDRIPCQSMGQRPI